MLCSRRKATLVVIYCLSLCLPALAAQANSKSGPRNTIMADDVPTTTPAEKCLGDLHFFVAQMMKDGYSIGASDHGSDDLRGSGGYRTARPGYEIQTLLGSATILAQKGDERACQTVLATARAAYERYATAFQESNVIRIAKPDWLNQIIGAQAVTRRDPNLRPDQLLHMDVLSSTNNALGNVHDVVMNPQTGAIAYLILSRSGVFGFDASYIPVPWADFKISSNGNLLVLDTTNQAMNDAPQVTDEQFWSPGGFDKQSETVNAYWSLRIKVDKASN